MESQVLQAVGGLGLFLFGMIVLTEGLHSLAGDAVHRVLFRFTKSPASGAATGALVTAVLQSSSVTTVATVGFVSAGLLAFPQALGVLFGANIGTTATGWMVALLGFELDIETLILPLLFVGVLLRLFGRRQVASLGWALAGFSALFLGLDAMQAGMAGFQGVVTPDDFPPDTFLGRLLLVGIGVGVTLVTQSSSAGIATALTALDAGAIALPQAAAMVIGMDIGTTSTTAVATLGGSVATRRTGYAHVVYNLLTGVFAFLLLGPFLLAVEGLFGASVTDRPTVVLVAFHTAFNGLGVLAVLPFTRSFARLMTRLVPDPGPDPAASLDASLLGDPTAASMALAGALRGMTVELYELLARGLDGNRPAALDQEQLARIETAVEQGRRFADAITATPQRPDAQRLLLACMHAIDHLERLTERCRDARIQTLRDDERLSELSGEVRAALESASRALGGEPPGSAEAPLEAVRDVARAALEPYRRSVLASVPDQRTRLDEALQRLDAIRWLVRSTDHAWRIAHYLEPARAPDGPKDPGGPDDPDAPPETRIADATP